jgi:hypothetical protein
VKTSLYSVFFLLVSDLATAFCFFPFLLLLWKKLGQEKAYLIISIYWLANGIINLPNWFGEAKNFQFQSQLSLLYNLIDTPLVLLVFYFSSLGQKKKLTLYFLLTFILFELVTIGLNGYNDSSNMIIIGTGTVLALAYSVVGITQYFKKMEHDSFENAMGFVYASFLFSYGIFSIIYGFSYIKVKGAAKLDIFFLYYSSVILSTLLTSFGLWRYAKPTLKNA